MAYLRALELKCDCGRKATVEVFDRQNTPYGKKCRGCGVKLVKELNKQEQSLCR